MSNSFGAKGNLHRQTTSGQSGGGGDTSRALGGGGLGGGEGSSSSKFELGGGERVEQLATSGGSGGEVGASGTIKRRARYPQVSSAVDSVERQDTFDEPLPLGQALFDSTTTSGGKSSTTPSSKRPASGGAGSFSGGKIISPGGTTSNTQRLSSIEILNENKQRQLQLEQQESFKQHLEQRQRLIQLQHQQEQAQQAYNSQLIDELNNSCSAYRVDTSAPEYVRMAAAAAKTTQQQQQPSLGNRKTTGSGGGVGGAINPFNEESNSATVSGRSGFLSTLMGDASGEEQAASVNKSSKMQPPDGDVESGDDAESLSGAGGGGRLHDSAANSRYCKLAGQTGACSYNYSGGGGDDRPFYQKDIATLLGECRGSRKLVILIVAVALLLDNMLLTTVVPIIPAYLYKLRVVREHRQSLGGSNRSNLSATTGNKQSALDVNRDGRVDEDELQAELDRRINQSLAKAQDRFSGSFFHPRVLKPRDKIGNIIRDFDGEDDDDDDGDDQEARQENDREGRNNRFRMDDEDRKRIRRPRAESPNRKSSLASGGKMTTEMDDEYEVSEDEEDDDDDDDQMNSKNGKMDREKGQRQRQAGRTQASTSRPAVASQKMTSGSKLIGRGGPVASKASGTADKVASQIVSDKSGGRNDLQKDQEDENDDDDDEDSMATRKWNRLRASLREMAAKSGNDSEALGGMCVSMVLDRPSYFNQRGTSLKWRGRTNGADKGGDNEDDDEEEGEEEPVKSRQKDDASRRGSNGKQSAEGRRLNSSGGQRRPKVERLRPGPRMKNEDEDDGASKGDKQQEMMDESKAGDTGKTMIGDDEVIINHQDIVDESFEVGVMFASKPIVQALANPFVGAITNRVGFTLPMFLGFTIMFLSTIVFAFGETYATLFMARAIQGVGSACTSVAGMSMIADRFPDDAERGNAMAVALGGLALGVVIGPPFGGFMYEFFGKPTPFIVLAILALLDGLLQLLVLQPRVSKCQDEGASLMTLIKDPYILVAAGAITFANTGIGILEPALPLWMMDTMQAKNWEQGVAFLPAALSYLFSTNLFGNLGLRIGRWRSAMLGLVIIGCSLLLIPFASRVDHLILPNGAIGFAIGMVDSTMMPMLGYLVDIRHTSVYGSVYAIGDVAFCASFVFGPALSGTLVELIGFEGLIITTALICFAFAPLLVLLRDPPVRQANEAQLQEQSTLRYVNYNHLDSPDEEAQLTTNNATVTSAISGPSQATNTKPTSSTAR